MKPPESSYVEYEVDTSVQLFSEIHMRIWHSLQWQLIVSALAMARLGTSRRDFTWHGEMSEKIELSDFLSVCQNPTRVSLKLLVHRQGGVQGTAGAPNIQ